MSKVYPSGAARATRPTPIEPPGAADILDDHGLAERSAHALGHDARGGIGRSARRERHHQRDLARRIVLRLRKPNCRR